jgi:hypothetical protein
VAGLFVLVGRADCVAEDAVWAKLNHAHLVGGREQIDLCDRSVIIFHRNILAGVVRHESCRCETHDRANGDVD